MRSGGRAALRCGSRPPRGGRGLKSAYIGWKLKDVSRPPRGGRGLKFHIGGLHSAPAQADAHLCAHPLPAFQLHIMLRQHFHLLYLS